MLFPQTVDLTRYQENAELPLRYHISSVISHAGSLNGGHYIATVKGKASRITNISDTRKERFTETRLMQSPQRPTVGNPSDVFVLTYIRDDGPLTARQKELLRTT